MSSVVENSVSQIRGKFSKSILDELLNALKGAQQEILGLTVAQLRKDQGKYEALLEEVSALVELLGNAKNDDQVYIIFKCNGKDSALTLKRLPLQSGTGAQ